MKYFLPLYAPKSLKNKNNIVSFDNFSLLTDCQFLPECLAAILFYLIFICFYVGNSYSPTNNLIFVVLIAFAIRISWNLSIAIHGFGHSLIKVLVDGDISSFTVESVLENRNLIAVFRSCIPFQQIVLPGYHHHDLPWLAVGDSIPWKVRCKAAGGLIFNILAFGLAARLHDWESIQGIANSSQSLPVAVVLSTAMLTFLAANALAAISSCSDVVAITTGRADYLYCGNFGFIATKTGPMLEGLISQSWLDLFKTMGRETEVRGEQAGGGLTLAQDSSGRSYFVGDKIVNAKRSNLTQSLESVFYRTRNRAWRAGFRPRQDNVLGVWHYRFSTSSAPSVLETHWHEWTPPHFETVWQLKNGQWVNDFQNVNHRITHNGDFETWQLFGKLVDYKTLGLWLERVLNVPNQTVGDSAKIAGMVDLLITQGMWLPSVRLAYQLMIASSIADAFGGEPIAKESPNTAPHCQELKKWAKLCESAFVEHLNQLTTADELTTPDSLCQLQQLIIKNFQQEPAFNQIDECTLSLFARTTIESFLHNDSYRAAQLFMLRARGSFGLVLVSTLTPDNLILSSLGQPISIGVNPQKSYSIYASEPSAVDAVLLHHPETYRLDLNQNAGEIAILSPTHQVIYSMTEKRELQAAEVLARRVPYHQHYYFRQIPQIASPSIDLIEKDLHDIPALLQKIQTIWVNPASLNRQSAEHLLNLLINKAKYLANKQKKLDSLGLDPVLAESRHVDILITGIENSLWLGENFAKDLKTIFPLLSITALSSNVVLQKLQHDFASLGLARQSIVFAISQSGQTFSTRQVLYASELLVRQGVIREFFVLTGEPTSFIGSTLTAPIYPEDTFSRRLFTNESGRRLAEPATVNVAATHQTLTELLFYLTRQMQMAFPGQCPLGMTLSPESLLMLQNMENEFCVQSLVDIVGATVEGKVITTRLHRQIVEYGQQWALHITETPLAWAIHALYILVTVGWGIPLAQTLTRGVLIGTHLSTTNFFAKVLLADAILADICIYIFGPWLWTLAIRLIQKRPLLARTGKRALIIGDVSWVQQTLRNYVSKLFSLSYGIASLEIHSANPQDHMVHKFSHRVVRGTLLFFGSPDGRCSQKQRYEENSVLMTMRQAMGIQHLRTGPEVVAVGSNPILNDQSFTKVMVLPSPIHKGCEENQPPSLTNNLIETLRESRFGSLRRLLASYVFFWALAKRVASFPLLRYSYWKSQSRTKIMTTASPVSAANLDRPEQEEVSILDLHAFANRDQS